MYNKLNCAVMGSINMDFIMRMSRVPEMHENVLGTDYGYAFGGKGANQATALAKLGANAKIIGKVADDDNGRRLISNLDNLGINTSGVSKNGAQTGLAAILIDGEGRNRIIVYEGANSEIEPKEAISHLDSNTDLLLVQFETNEDAVVSIVNHAIKNNITTVVDCGPAKNFNLERMQGITILSPNENETEALTGIFPSTEEDVLNASKKLWERSKAKYVVLKLGERGCSVWDNNTLKILPSYKSNVVDTTAAGDCFTAAMALHYKLTGDIYASCDIGNKAGSIAVSRMGAADSMPTAEELKNVK